MFRTNHLFRFVNFFILLALILTPISSARATGIRYAAPSAVGSGDCSSWANACTLQTALSQAVGSDEIWVQAGVHYPGAAGDRSATFQLKNGVAVYGGFDGTETSREQRNWTANQTILSGDIDQNDTHGGDYINEAASQNVGSNTYHVVSAVLSDSSTVLDGFIITAGQANGSTYDGLGGGMFNQFSSSSMANLIFSGNAATYGGGMYNNYSDPTLNTVTLHGNSATSDGGGINNYHSSPDLNTVTIDTNTAPSGNGGGMINDHSSNPTLTNVTFSINSASNGGGMYNRLSSPSLIQVSFSTNEAYDSGGGMANQSSNPTLTNVTFSDNYAYAYGGGMLNHSSSPQLTNVSFNTNGVEGCGGGMANLDASHPQLINGLFRSNTGFSCGGGLFNEESNPTLINVTFNGNSAVNNSGGGIYNDNSSPTLTNVILWGDSAPSAAEISNTGSNAPVISFSDIQGGYTGTGNINADPLFDSNLHLQLTSPAIDAGDNAVIPASITTDLDGKLRFVDIPTVSDTGSGTPPIVDMGAYEAQSSTYTLYTLTVNKSGTGSGTVTSSPAGIDCGSDCVASYIADTPVTLTAFPAAGSNFAGWSGDCDSNGLVTMSANKACTATFTQNPPSAVIHHAAPTAQGSGDCSSWANACTLQTALSTAVSGNEIWVRAGVHYPGSARTDTFSLKSGVSVYGGFAGTEISRDERDWQTNKTILSGDIDHNDYHGGDYINDTDSEILGSNAYHVVSAALIDASAVLDGFIITAGQANGSTYDGLGGGMFNQFNSPSLVNITFSGNAATYGGGMYNYYSNPTLNTVTLHGNSATADGGGMVNYHSSPNLNTVTLDTNTAPSGNGGGMTNDDGSNPILTNVTFSTNSAYTYGGGMLNRSSSPQLTNVSFNTNGVEGCGGGMANLDASHPQLINGVFRSNTGFTCGGGIFNDSSNPTLINVTFNGNVVYNDSGGGIYNDNSSPTLTNVILWGDSAPNAAELFNTGSSTPLISYSDIQGGYVGTGNINADPLFDGNLHLQLTSPAIDAGNNAALPSGITSDLDDNPRLLDVPAVTDTGSGTPPIVDMGAYETVGILYASLAAQGNGECYAWEHACTLKTAINVAISGQEIWVKQGVYYPGSNRSDSFPMKDGVSIYGGFNGTETARSQRNWQTNKTILSGDIDNNDTHGGDYINENTSQIVGNNAYHVINCSGWTNTAVLDGFTITAGQANGSNPNNRGGGMYNSNSCSPIITNIIFSGNSASYDGGGMANSNSSPRLTNVIFYGNSATYGGGMVNGNSSPTLTTVILSGNSAFRGGGMYNYSYSNPTLTNAILWGNTANYSASIYYDSSTSVTSYSDIQGGHIGTGNINADPLFVDAANGNLRLGFGSPAIDAGTNTGCPATDIDGLPRPADGNGDGTATCDMGAYEAGQMVCGVTQGNTYVFNDQSGVSIEVTTLGDLACLYVNEMDIIHPNATPGLQTGRYWLIRGLQSDKQTDATGFTVNLTLPTTFTPDTDDKVCRYTGSGQVWDCDMSSYTTNSITRNGVTAFSDWAVGNNVDPTAVKLQNFQASSSPFLLVWLFVATVAIAVSFTKKWLAKP